MKPRLLALAFVIALALLVLSDAVPLRAKPKGKPKPTFLKEPVDKRTDKVGGYNCCRLCPMLFYAQRLMPWLKKGKSLIEQDSSISFAETDSLTPASLPSREMATAPILHYVYPGSVEGVHPAFDNEHIRPLPMSSFLQEVQRLHGAELARIEKKKGKKGKPHRLCCNVCYEPYTEDTQYPDMLYYTGGVPPNSLLRKDKTGRVFKGADPLVFAETDVHATVRQKARASREATVESDAESVLEVEAATHLSTEAEAEAETEAQTDSKVDASFVFDWKNIQKTMKQFFRRRNAVKKRPNKFQLGTPPCCKFCPLGCPEFESKATFIEEEGILHAIPMSLIEQHMSANLSEWLDTDFSPSVQFVPADEEIAHYDLHRVHAHHHKFRGIFKKAKGAVKKVVKKIKDLLKKKGKKLLDKVKDKAAELKDKAASAMDDLKDKAAGAMDDLKEKAEGAISDLKEKAEGALDAVKDAAKELDPASLAAKAIHAARKTDAIAKMKKGLKRVKDWFKNKAKAVVGLGKKLSGAAKKAVKKGFKVLKDFMKKKFGAKGPKAIEIPPAGTDLRVFQDKGNPSEDFDPPGADGKDPRCTKEMFGKCCYLCPTTWSQDAPPRNPKVHVKSAKLEELKKKTNNPQLRDPLKDKTPLSQHRDPLKITVEDIKSKQPAAVHALEPKDAPKEGFYWAVKGEAMKAPAPKPRDVANEGGYNSPMERAKNADVQLTGEQNNPIPPPAANSEAASGAPPPSGESSSE